jgi:hypothetical protein
MWSNFAKYQNPNGDGVSSPWTPTTSSDYQVFRISDASAMESWTDPEKCDYWTALDNSQWFSTCNDVFWDDTLNDSCSCVIDTGITLKVTFSVLIASISLMI